MASTSDNPSTVEKHLLAAIETDDPKEKNYYIRNALQVLKPDTDDVR